MLRDKSNCSVIEVLPNELEDVISVMPAMCPSCRSSGVATDEAMISALAPGRLEETEIAGKSACGSGETGNTVNPTAPAIATAIVSSVVATGRRMNGSEMLMSPPDGLPGPRCPPFGPACGEKTSAPAGQRRCK